MSKKSKFAILCLDGGGVRGLAPLRILQQIKEETGKEPREIFDMICGTSTGGIIAILHGILGIPLEKCVQLYRELCGKIFHISHVETGAAKVTRGYSEYGLTILRLYKDKAKYNHTIFEQVAKDILKQCNEPEEMKMNDKPQSASIPFVFVVSTKMQENNSALFLFRNYENKLPNNAKNLNEGDDSVKIWQAFRATSAAPTFFSPIEIENLGLFEDGGIMANNPSEIALVEYKDSLYSSGKSKKPILLVSIGTGKQIAATGIARYLQALINSENVHQKMLNRSEDSREELTYHRLDPDNLQQIDFDDPKKADEIIKVTEHYINNKGKAEIESVVRDIKNIF